MRVVYLILPGLTLVPILTLIPIPIRVLYLNVFVHILRSRVRVRVVHFALIPMLILIRMRILILVRILALMMTLNLILNLILVRNLKLGSCICAHILHVDMHEYV